MGLTRLEVEAGNFCRTLFSNANKAGFVRHFYVYTPAVSAVCRFVACPTGRAVQLELASVDTHLDADDLSAFLAALDARVMQKTELDTRIVRTLFDKLGATWYAGIVRG